MKRWLNIFFQIISVLLFVVILLNADPETWQLIVSGSLPMLLLAGILSGVSQMVSGWRLQILTQSITGKKDIGWRHFYHVTMTSRGMSLILPRSVSIFGAKSVALKAVGVPMTRAVWAVFMDKAYDLGYLALLAIPGFFYLRGDLAAAPLLISVLLITVFLAVGLWWGIRTGLLARLVHILGRIPKIGKMVRPADAEAGELLPAGPVAFHALLLTALHSGVVAFSFYFIARAIYLDAAWLDFVAAFPMTQLSLVLAFAPGGLGVFDVSWLALLALVGWPDGDLTNFIIAQRAYTTVFVLFWWGFSALLAFLYREKRSKQWAVNSSR